MREHGMAKRDGFIVHDFVQVLIVAGHGVLQVENSPEPVEFRSGSLLIRPSVVAHKFHNELRAFWCVNISR